MAGLFKRQSGRIYTWDEDALFSPTEYAKDPILPARLPLSTYRIELTWAELRFEAAPGVTIACTAGAAEGAGAPVLIGSNITIACTAGAAAGAGAPALIGSNITIACTAGAAQGAGGAATLGSGIIISCSPGRAEAAGAPVGLPGYELHWTWAELRYALSSTPVTITCVAGAAQAAGAPATVTAVASYRVHWTWAEARYQPTLVPTTISCTAGRALGAGKPAGLELMLALPMNVGAAGARGPRGVVFEIVDSMVMNVGAAEAAGLAFSLTSPTAIACTAGRGAARGRPALLSAANVTIDCGIGAATAYGPAAALSVVQTVACTPAGGAAHGSVVTIVDGPSGPIIFCFRGRAVGAGAPIEFALSAEFRVGAAVARGARATVESGIELYATGSVIGQSSMNPTLMAARGSMGAYAYLDGGPGRAHGLFKMRSRLTPDMRFTVREN